MKTKEIIDHSDLFNQYLYSCKGEVKSQSSEGYYHVDVVADAYKRGFSDGEKSGQEDYINSIITRELEKFTERANQIYILSKNVISLLDKINFNATALYMNLTPNRNSVIIAVPSESLVNDAFIEQAYAKIFENKKIYSKLFNEIFDIGFLSSDNLDQDMISQDGFGYVETYK